VTERYEGKAQYLARLKVERGQLSVALTATRTCWNSEAKGGCYLSPTDALEPDDAALLKRVGVKNKHESILEHCSISFHIDGLSRGALQELARHRHQSLSVQSTRYTLKKRIKDAPVFQSIEDVGEYCVLTGEPGTDQLIFQAMLELQLMLKTHGIPNDISKYALPEALRTTLVSTWNIRGLRNFLSLRLSKAAHWEIRNLAIEFIATLPKEWLPLFEDVIDAGHL